MAEPGTDAAAGCPEFSELWRKISEGNHSKRQSRRGAEQMAVTATAPGRKGLQSPRFRGGSRFPGSNNAESPGDVEASQDIFWDGTSPTQTVLAGAPFA
ncbi:hypothetical protein ATANTOWER_022694 [Ataeniobius toweri]|uniref:Uncharacterized protein n=1 Tax=Ataeniobius toweri TaxID=208326 RepID=A0ABU7B0D4_9TELE|nr:hypothetical protein [Ataeniobius toweri]